MIVKFIEPPCLRVADAAECQRARLLLMRNPSRLLAQGHGAYVKLLDVIDAADAQLTLLAQSQTGTENRKQKTENRNRIRDRKQK